MPQTHLVSQDRLDKTLEEAEENDRNVDAIRDMYVTPEDAVGRVFKKMFDWGYTFYEAVDVDYEEEELILEELFTGREFTEDIGEILHVPLIGNEHTVSWIEARVDGEWKRVSNYSTPDDWQGLPTQNDEYDQTRTVEKTYRHGEDEFEAWPIRVEHKSGEPEVAIDGENVKNDGVLEQVLESIKLPDSFDLASMKVGTIYTDTHIIEGEYGPEEEYEVVWWSIKHQFTGSNRQRVSPVTTLDRKVTV